MVITVPAVHVHSASGLRPINLNRDIPQVMDLLQVAFGESLDEEGRQLLTGNASLSQQAPFLWRMSPAAGKLALGYVWEENGHIIGNATLLHTRVNGRYLVVNVAVHPDQRRRGIARSLMNAIIDLVRARSGRQILLQVVKNNRPAVELYNSLQFATLDSITSWQASVSRLRDLPASTGGGSGPYIRELGRQEWQAAYRLDQLSLHPDLNWPEPLPPDTYKTGLWRGLSNFLNGRQIETWVTVDSQNRLSGLASIISEWSRAHQVSIRIHPVWRGRLERPLLEKTIRRLRYLPRRNVNLDYLDEDVVMDQLLREANFRPRRTLTHMRLDLG